MRHTARRRRRGEPRRRTWPRRKTRWPTPKRDRTTADDKARRGGQAGQGPASGTKAARTPGGQGQGRPRGRRGAGRHGQGPGACDLAARSRPDEACAPTRGSPKAKALANVMPVVVNTFDLILLQRVGKAAPAVPARRTSDVVGSRRPRAAEDAAQGRRRPRRSEAAKTAGREADVGAAEANVKAAEDGAASERLDSEAFFTPGVPVHDVPVPVHRLRHQGAGLPVPHLAARRPRRGADADQHDPGRRPAQAGRLRHHPHRLSDLSVGRRATGLLGRAVRRHQHRLRRLRGHGPDRLQEAGRLQLRQPHGLRHPRHRRLVARGRTRPTGRGA